MNSHFWQCKIIHQSVDECSACAHKQPTHYDIHLHTVQITLHSWCLKMKMYGCQWDKNRSVFIHDGCIESALLFTQNKTLSDRLISLICLDIFLLAFQFLGGGDGWGCGWQICLLLVFIIAKPFSFILNNKVCPPQTNNCHVQQQANQTTTPALHMMMKLSLDI